MSVFQTENGTVVPGPYFQQVVDALRHIKSQATDLDYVTIMANGIPLTEHLPLAEQMDDLLTALHDFSLGVETDWTHLAMLIKGAVILSDDRERRLLAQYAWCKEGGGNA
jgi:hypothetical protein